MGFKRKPRPTLLFRQASFCARSAPKQILRRPLGRRSAYLFTGKARLSPKATALGFYLFRNDVCASGALDLVLDDPHSPAEALQGAVKRVVGVEF